MNKQDVFARIYETNAWEGDESRSGPGSSLEATAFVRRWLLETASRLSLRTVLDAGCGDFNWMSQVPLDVDWYVGVDVVESVIAANRSNYSNAVRSFRVLDIVTDELPRADVIICRDCLVHLPTSDVLRAIDNFKNSGAKFLIATTFPGLESANSDIPVGGWRPLDMNAPPFNLGLPIDMVREGLDGEFRSKSSALWALTGV